MVINFDKNIDPNITSIKTNNVEFEMVNLVTGGSMGWSIDLDSNTITFLGTTDVQITFNDIDALDIYAKQLEFATSKPYNPYVDGVNENPSYTKLDHGEIVPHTYEDTDVEQDLINNG